MPERTNSIQVCKIQGCDPIIRLKGWTPEGAYDNLTRETKEQIDELSLTDFSQYQEIGRATVDVETGEVINLEFTE